MNLFNWYKQAYIYKVKDKKEIPFELRPLCYEMHGMFLDTNYSNMVNRMLSNTKSSKLSDSINSGFNSILIAFCVWASF